MRITKTGANEVRQFTYYPQRIADFVTIGKDAVVEAAQIGSGVDIGEGAVIVSSKSPPS